MTVKKGNKKYIYFFYCSLARSIFFIARVFCQYCITMNRDDGGDSDDGTMILIVIRNNSSQG